MNEHGLAAAMTFVMTGPERIQAGFNSCFIVRYLLEKADSAENALSLLVELPIASNCNILVADKSGEMAVVECSPFVKRVREAVNLNNGRIVCTVNRFTSDEMKPYETAGGNDYHSGTQYQVVMDSFPAHIKEDFIKTTQQLLKGDYGFMCQYDEEPDFETVWSSVFDLKSLMMYRAEGDPRINEFLADSALHDMVRRDFPFNPILRPFRGNALRVPENVYRLNQRRSPARRPFASHIRFYPASLPSYVQRPSSSFCLPSPFFHSRGRQGGKRLDNRSGHL